MPSIADLLALRNELDAELGLAARDVADSRLAGLAAHHARDVRALLREVEDAINTRRLEHARELLAGTTNDGDAQPVWASPDWQGKVAEIMRQRKEGKR